MMGVRSKTAHLARAAVWMVAIMAVPANACRLFAQAPRPAPAAEVQVVDVRVDGLRGVPLAQVLAELETRAGRPFREAMVQRDVRQLVTRGWFVHVEPLYEEVAGGRIVVFRVLERPTLRYVEYLGNSQYSDSKLAKETGLEAGAAVDPYAIEEARRKIIEFYKEHGYNNVQVDVPEGLKASDQGATFVITEGQLQRIAHVEFIGNTIASDPRLKTQIQSKPGILWMFRGYVDRKKIDEDVERLTAYYRSLGFFRARVAPDLSYSGFVGSFLPSDGSDSSGGWLTLSFVIDEGPRYRVRNVSFIGHTKFESQELAAAVKLEAGEYFDQASMNRDLATLRDMYGSQGHVFADVKADPRFLEEPGQLDLVYDIEEGERYRVGRIRVHIQGENPHTRRQTVLNRVSLETGDVLDTGELRRSERRLRAAGIFDSQPLGGAAPRIVFSPPGTEDARVARRGRSRSREQRGARPPGPQGSGSRFQSPDTPRSVFPAPVPKLPAGERLMDLVVVVDRPPTAPRKSSASARHVARHAPIARAQSPGAPAGAFGGQPMGSMGPSSSPTVGFPPSRAHGAYSPQAPTATGGYAQPVTQRGGYVQPTRAFPQQTNASTQPARGNRQVVAANAQGTFAAGDGAVQAAPYYPAAQPVPAGRPSQYAQAVPQNASVGQNTWVQNPPAGSIVTPAPLPVVGQSSNISGTAPGGVPVQPVAVPSGGPLYADPTVPPFYYEPLQELPLDIYVNETQTGRFMIGVGVNSDAGVIGTVTVDEQNFDITRFPTSFDDLVSGRAWRGAGQRFRLEAQPGTEVQRYLASFQEPYLLDYPVSFGLSGFFYDRRFRDWDEQRMGARGSLGYQLTPDLSTTFSYRYESVNIHNPAVPTPPELLEAIGDNNVHGFRGTLTHDTRDSVFLATEGHYIQLAYEQVIGSFDYPRAELDVRQYFLINERPDGSGRHVLSLSGRVGVSGSNTPIYDRFYAGGFSTIRGFRFRGASPTNMGVKVGGDFLMLGSAEYLLPITADDMLRAVAFVDFGTVEQDIEINDFRVVPGFGLRVTVPAMGPAPIALDFGFPVVEAPNDERRIFSFNVGLQR